MTNGDEHSYWGVFRKHKVITSWVDLPIGDAIRFGDKVKHGGRVVGYYIKDGYNVVELNYKVGGSGILPEKLKYRVVYTLVYLNPELSFDALVECAEAYLGHLMDSRKVQLKKEWVKSLVDYCSDNLKEAGLYKRKRFFWNEEGRLLPSQVKQSISGVYTSLEKKKDTLEMIGLSVFSLMEESDEFVTVKLLSDGIEGSPRTVKRYINLFREDIDNHNLNTFGTDDRSVYTKTQNMRKIKKAMDDITIEQSKAAIAKATGLHYNTVLNLWGDVVRIK